MKKVYITIDACRRRGLDAVRIRSYFIENGYEIVDDPKNADIIIFVACAFHGHMASKNFKIIEKLQRYKGELIVAGCLPIIEREKLSKIFNGRTLGTKDIHNIDKLFPENKIKFKDVEDGNVLIFNKKHGNLKNKLRRFKLLEKLYVRVFDFLYKNIFGKNSFMYTIFPKKPIFHIRVAWGCNSNCTYCVIRKSNGPFISKPLDQCINELKKGLSSGYKKFMITAVNPGYYGIDINSSLPELFDKLTKVPGDFEILVRGIYPEFLIRYIDELEEIVKRDKIKLIGIPIQSGSKRILELMSRNVDLVKLKNAIKRLQDANQNLVIDIHYIIGFPTETDDDFQETLNLIKEIDSKVVYFFPFSIRPDTEAAKFEPRVTEQQIKLRIKRARKILKSYGYLARNITGMRLPLFEKNR